MKAIDLREELAVLQFVAVEPLHQFLARMDDDLARHRNAPQPIHGPRIELERALILELLQDVLLDLLERRPAR